MTYYGATAELNPSVRPKFFKRSACQFGGSRPSSQYPLMEALVRTLNRRSLLTAGLGTIALSVAATPAWAQRPVVGGCALCSCAGYAFGGNAANLPPRIAKSSGDPETDRFLGRALARLASTFQVSPGFAFFDDGNSPNAFASSETLVGNGPGTVLMGMRLFSQLMARRDNGIAVIGVCAHEFAHIHQMSGGYRGRLASLHATVKPVELHADFLCGYYMARRKAEHQGLDLKVLALEMYKRGDTDVTSRQHHGTPDERLGALSAGYGFGKEGNRDIAQAADAGLQFVKRSS